MKIKIFEMERMQSQWENVVDYNLSESGVHPVVFEELVSPAELKKILKTGLGYIQSNGTKELKTEIARLYPGAGLDQILVTSGSSEANYLTIWKHVEPGDEVIFELPNYMQMGGLLKSFGAKVKPLYLRESLDWNPDLDELKKLVTKKTKMIIVTNPNNPTGSVLTGEAMKTIIDLASKVGAWIVSDEVYQGAERSGKTTPSFWGRYDKLFVVNGLSKAYGLPGLRIGWVVGPADSIDQIWPYHDYTTISVGAVSDMLARIALTPGNREKIINRTRAILNHNFPVINAWFKKQDGIFSFVPPKAGAICFARYNFKMNSTRFVEKLIREKSVLIVPGDQMGLDGYLRFGYGNEEPYLRAGLARIAGALKDLKKP
jgi:aspartate/methionine/tyrosine aminotransferase